MKPSSGNAEPRLGPTAEEAKPGLGAPRGASVGWHSRGYLPHFDSFGVAESVTFRSEARRPPGVKGFIRSFSATVQLVIADNETVVLRYDVIGKSVKDPLR